MSPIIIISSCFRRATSAFSSESRCRGSSVIFHNCLGILYCCAVPGRAAAVADSTAAGAAGGTRCAGIRITTGGRLRPIVGRRPCQCRGTHDFQFSSVSVERTAQSILASVQVRWERAAPLSAGSNSKWSRTKKVRNRARLVSAGESSFARKNAKRYTQARVSKQRTGVGGTTLYKLSPGPEERRHLKLSPAASLENTSLLQTCKISRPSPIQEISCWVSGPVVFQRKRAGRPTF